MFIFKVLVVDFASFVMEPYTFDEYTDMLLIYGQCSRNSREAAREYSTQFPRRRHPSHHLFSVVERRCRTTGYLGPPRRRERQLGQEDLEDAVMEHFRNNPRTSIRRASNELDTSRSTIHRTLRRNRMYPYHDTPVQELIHQDFHARMEFSNWFLENNIPHLILWSDEATFTRTGAVNFHNTHTWATENPHTPRPHNFQHQFSINVWAGIVDGNIVGPYFFPHRLDGAAFLEFLNGHFSDLIEDVPIELRRNMWFQMDGCPAHYSRDVRNWLNENFPGRWIGRGGPVAWPARSPDLTPLDFYLWGTVKSLVYNTGVDTREELRQRILDAFHNVKGRVEELRTATRNVQMRSRVCLQVNGGHFEQLL